MKILFCDLCNESVPQADLDAGRARTVKGRVICAACDAAMSHGGAPGSAGGAVAVAPAPRAATLAAAAPAHAAPPAAATPPARSGTGVAWVAALALAFTALTIFVTDDRLAAVGREQGRLTTDLAAQNDALRGLQADAATVHPALQALEARLGARMDQQAQRSIAQGDTLGALREDNARLLARVEALAGEVERLRARVDEPGLGVALEKRLDEFSARLARADDERRALSGRIDELAQAAAAAPAVAAGAAPAGPGEPPEWTKLLPDLKSAEESLRWEAVTSLGATKDPAVVAHIVPALKDASVFVRMAAARVLGELSARDAVPSLIDTLEDADSAVRETAWIALRAITGKDIKFDPYANEAERARRAKAWREWWSKEGGGEAAPG